MQERNQKNFKRICQWDSNNGKKHKKLGRSQIFIQKLLACIFFIYIFSDTYPQNLQIMLFWNLFFDNYFWYTEDFLKIDSEDSKSLVGN